MSDFDVLIVGGGHSGAHAAAALRQRKFEGSICIVGEELELPYERPSLSKDYLSGEKTFARLLLRPADFWEKHGVTMAMGRQVVSVDPARRIVSCADGSTIGFHKLIWAAGGHARRLTCAGQDLAGVYSIRSRADVDRIVAELPATSRVVVVGGGYVGLEAAAVLAGFGKQITILEAQDRVLARVAGTTLSRFFESQHRAHGVDIQLGVTVDCILGERGRATAVMLADGQTLRADMVIVGIGLVPSVRPLLDAGASGGDGVAVDEYGCTTLPDIFAVGDCALHTNAFGGELPMRLESVQNANDMAANVAKTISGAPEPLHAVPCFWSHQYDLKLQTVGLSKGHDLAVVRGDISSRSFSIVYLRKGRVSALDCVNATRDYVQGRTLVATSSTIDPAALADAEVSLKELV